jgi:hypothetical protein
MNKRAGAECEATVFVEESPVCAEPSIPLAIALVFRTAAEFATMATIRSSAASTTSPKAGADAKVPRGTTLPTQSRSASAAAYPDDPDVARDRPAAAAHTIQIVAKHSCGAGDGRPLLRRPSDRRSRRRDRSDRRAVGREGCERG